jgi:perosamine synthetase
MQTSASHLAMFGGPSAVDKSGLGSWPIVTQADKDAISAVMERGVFSGISAPEITALERDFSAYTGLPYVLAVNTCTSALHCALFALGIGHGDEVIIPEYGFITVGMVPLYQNAVPVFVDVDPELFTINTELLEAAITSKTRAIIAAHLHGLMCDMVEITRICKKYGLKLIEDCGHAAGASYKGRMAGTWGDVSCFSLNSNKQIPGGEGGLLATSDENIYKNAALFRNYGLDRSGDIGQYDILSWKYRNHELPCALARSQLSRLDEMNDWKRDLCGYLTAGLQKIPLFVPPKEPDGYKHVYTGYRVSINPNEVLKLVNSELLSDPYRLVINIVAALEAEGVAAQVWTNRPISQQKLFQELKAYGRGCPWSCTDSPQDYSTLNPSGAWQIVRQSFVVWGARPPHSRTVMDDYLHAFEKIAQNLLAVVGASQ